MCKVFVFTNIVMSILPYITLIMLFIVIIYVFDQKYSLLSRTEENLRTLYRLLVSNKKESIYVFIGLILITILIINSFNTIRIYSEVSKQENINSQPGMNYDTITEQLLIYSPDDLDNPLFLFSHNDPTSLRIVNNTQYGHMQIKIGSVFAKVSSNLPVETYSLDPFEEFENITQLQISYFFVVLNTMNQIEFETNNTITFNSTTPDTFSKDIIWEPKYPGEINNEYIEEFEYEVLKSVYVSYSFPNGTFESLSTGSTFIRWSHHSPFVLSTINAIDPNFRISWVNNDYISIFVLPRILPVVIAIVFYSILSYREFKMEKTDVMGE